jgi:hypothetical protein
MPVGDVPRGLRAGKPRGPWPAARSSRRQCRHRPGGEPDPAVAVTRGDSGGRPVLCREWLRPPESPSALGWSH